MLKTICVAGCLVSLNLVVPAMAAGPRDAALAPCNAAAINRWSYHGTVYDKEDNRYAVYRTAWPTTQLNKSNRVDNGCEVASRPFRFPSIDDDHVVVRCATNSGAPMT